MAKYRSDETTAYLYRLAMGRQTSLPGTSADIAGLLRHKAAAPILAAKPQKPCDIGLFSDDADQLDLVSWFTEQTEE